MAPGSKFDSFSNWHGHKEEIQEMARLSSWTKVFTSSKYCEYTGADENNATRSFKKTITREVESKKHKNKYNSLMVHVHRCSTVVASADLTTEMRVTVGLTARYRNTITFPVRDRVSMQL